MFGLQYFKNLGITSKFILWFLIIALVPLAIATYVSYNSSRRVLEEEVANSLLAIADNKVNQIEAYFREKEKNVTMLSYMSDIIDAIERFAQACEKSGIDSPEYRAVDQELRPFLTYYQKLFGYDNLLLICPKGEIVFSVEGNSLPEIARYKDSRGSELAKVFTRINESFFAKVEISDFEYYPQTKKGIVFIAAPVFKGADLIGVVVAQMTNQGLCEFGQDYTGLGKTGEIVITSKKDNEVVFLTPLRFDPDAAFSRRVTIGAPEVLDIQKAVQEEKGTAIAFDYRGTEVLSVWRHLPTFRLGMALKMDTVEVFASANRLRNSLLTISLVLLIMVVIMAILIARTVSSPIKELTRVSGTIAGGILSARAEIDTEDEIGKLATSFNQMTDRLIKAKANVEQKKAQLEEQKGLLEKANKELDSFVYTASHDLRAPLRGITAFANFLEQDYKDKLDAEGRDYLQEISKGTSRMNALIEDLLKLSRISRIKNPNENVDINELIDSTIERIKFDIKEYKVDLKIQQDLPTVKCDRIKMAEVFLNLINNAIKFSSKGIKGNPKVEIGYADKNEFHELFVRDNGIGIDPKYHEKIFGIFKRLHTDKEYAGTGVGLNIVKRIIDDHNGKIWIESEFGKGATFYFTIPKELKRKMKIGELLVENGLISQEALRQELKKQGIEDIGPSEYKGASL